MPNINEELAREFTEQYARILAAIPETERPQALEEWCKWRAEMLAYKIR